MGFAKLFGFPGQLIKHLLHRTNKEQTDARTEKHSFGHVHMSEFTHVPMAVFTRVVKLERNVLLAWPDPTVNAWAGQFCFLVTFGILSSSSNSCIQGDPVHAGLYLPPWPTMHIAQGGQHQLCRFMLFDSSP